MVKVSVLTAVYNTPEQYLREAIESILAQTYTDFEFVILNDASPDENVEKVVKSYNDKRIRYYKNEQNLGISLSRNKLIDLADGEYLAVFDHDDISLPDRLQKQAEFLDSHPDVGVVGNWHKITGKKERVARYPTTDKEIKETLTVSCCICHSSSMIRKSVLTENNIRYENEYTPAEDYALWCRLLPKTKFANIPEVLFIYRNHEQNTSHRQQDRMWNASVRIQNFVRRENPELWAVMEPQILHIRRIKLFGIPLLTIRYNEDLEVWRLFGFLPFIRIKKRNVLKALK